MNINWVCPHCDHAATLGIADMYLGYFKSTISGKDGTMEMKVSITVCPNPDCRLTTVEQELHTNGMISTGAGLYPTTKKLVDQRLRPPGYARPVPEYVPEAVRNDYIEACAIADLSPKASATLARRALQGMVRDFFGVAKRTLYDELDAVKDQVNPLTWQAIDAVRKIGNIGAHMEKDIDVIINVDPDEAVRLIRLIELLVREWYVAKHQREQSLAELIAISDKKQAERDKAPLSDDSPETTA